MYRTEHELKKEESVPLLDTKPDQSDYYNVNTEILVSSFTEYLQNKKRDDPDWYKLEFNVRNQSFINKYIIIINILL